MIVGLGNPGAQYAGTRHNVGFEIVESLAKAKGIALKTHRYQSQYGIGLVSGCSVVLVKPLTYMNLSGRAVASLARTFAIQPNHILVVADDMDLPLGRLRLKAKGSSGGHNGHKSIIQQLGTDEYPRLKVGIGKEGDAIDHVLSRFSPQERSTLSTVLSRSVEGCELWLSEGAEKAMNFLNSS